MAEWTREQISKLITLYEGFEQLYNPKHSFYSNKHSRANALYEIANLLSEMRPQTKVDEVKSKINTMRTHYSHEVKKVRDSAKSGAATEEIYQPTVWWFDKMTFLAPHIKARKSESSISATQISRNNEPPSNPEPEIVIKFSKFTVYMYLNISLSERISLLFIFGGRYT